MFPFTADNYVIPAFWDLAKIIERLTDKVHILIPIGAQTKTPKSDKAIGYKLNMKIGQRVVSSNPFARIFLYLEHECQTLRFLYCLRKDVDLVLSFQSLSLTALFLCRLMKKKSIVYIGGNPRETLFKSRSVFLKPLGYFSILLWKIQIRLATEVVTIAPNILTSFRTKKKAHYAYTRLLDAKFRITKPFSERKNIVGYVGRLEDEKGVQELASAFQLTIQKISLDFLVVGDGSLLEPMKKALGRKEVLSNVIFTGWVPKVQDYLNEMRLLVLPSKTEGLPSVVLEAMACGTPVLATPAGDIPSVIKDGFSGFVLESTKPTYIAEKIVELLGKSELLSQIAENASAWVKKNFSLERTLSQWQQILAS